MSSKSFVGLPPVVSLFLSGLGCHPDDGTCKPKAEEVTKYLRLLEPFRLAQRSPVDTSLFLESALDEVGLFMRPDSAVLSLAGSGLEAKGFARSVAIIMKCFGQGIDAADLLSHVTKALSAAAAMHELVNENSPPRSSASRGPSPPRRAFTTVDEPPFAPPPREGAAPPRSDIPRPDTAPSAASSTTDPTLLALLQQLLLQQQASLTRQNPQGIQQDDGITIASMRKLASALDPTFQPTDSDDEALCSNSLLRHTRLVKKHQLKERWLQYAHLAVDMEPDTFKAAILVEENEVIRGVVLSAADKTTLRGTTRTLLRAHASMAQACSFDGIPSSLKRRLVMTLQFVLDNWVCLVHSLTEVQSPKLAASSAR